MDGTLVERLRRRAECMLPPGAVMAVECAADGGDRESGALLEHILDCGLKGLPLCGEPYETVVFDDRVLLRCSGCPRQESLPRVEAEGFGRTPEEARRSALYALTLPPERGPRRWGEGPCRAVERACVFNRAAHLSQEAL